MRKLSPPPPHIFFPSQAAARRNGNGRRNKSAGPMDEELLARFARAEIEVKDISDLLDCFPTHTSHCVGNDPCAACLARARLASILSELHRLKRQMERVETIVLGARLE